ncbi:hypothetical protein CEUSTIGMA_g12828.t1 [Chlamydomonas eustigma]|uniref:glycerophosphodiester phosphodiesterase n=1 Tax=Chlamydomonas eustigma TaxID=1157962 RepID=A0A250XR41_9CHLO|nr:hypothetical protein CEUSTIGMA_g12828.t1 [Chlamydomonas eustigma]|eukprot:GAX85412.1 hypothetical protein CEUSTIGMA_g12828.t1 [Chlamydomonas eustigma]
MRRSTRFLIGGHRGVGENLWIEGSLPSPSAILPAYRENTVKSFLRAAELGVDFVEFDVQVTKDGIPVLWHDDTILQQSQELEKGGVIDTEKQTQASSTYVKDIHINDFKKIVTASSTEGSQYGTQLVREFRGVKTRAQLPGPLLPWICQVEDSLPTLEELFQAVPPSCGFDIEIKMTSGPEVEKTPPEEVERVVSAIWRDVSQFLTACQEGSGCVQRQVFFSSFDPDVCAAIAQRQQHCPVWYLSGCGLYPHIDERRTSFQAALDFISTSKLAGLVLPAKVLLSQEHVVPTAKALGIGIMTYGLENDDDAAIVKQKALELEGVIVDNVQALLAE